MVCELSNQRRLGGRANRELLDNLMGANHEAIIECHGTFDSCNWWI